jgi:hypothetical protein
MIVNAASAKTVANLMVLRLYGNFISDPPSELKDRLPITIETGELNFNANGRIVLAVLTGEAVSGQETLSCGAFGFFSPDASGRPHAPTVPEIISVRVIYLVKANCLYVCLIA